MAMRTLVAVIAIALLAMAAPAAEPGRDVPDVFDPAAARRPEAGEWLDYLVAFPVDPLENSLRSDAVPFPGDGTDAMEDDFFPPPHSDPPALWRTLPLRLEVLQVDAAGVEVRVTFAGQTQDAVLPHDASEPKAEFRYEAPQPPDTQATHRLGDSQLTVNETRRHGEHYGFVRWSDASVPFGIVRFATENVDLILVGMGRGDPPPFPPEQTAPPVPAPGRLYERAMP